VAAVAVNHDRSASGAFVHLFEWRWTDVARECETVLGPGGFAAVQVSPPSEHAIIASVSEPAPQPTVAYPWWQRYQTVDYQLDKSRSGTKSEFQDMVTRCAAVGVDVYVDAVINHMTAQTAGIGSNGTTFSKYGYPSLYSYSHDDFHEPTCAITSSDYIDSAYNVQHCELDSLADLNTGSAYVQETIADYLIALVQMGVGGFRVDAAKHITPSELQAIIGRVNAATAPIVPYYFLEVVDNPGEAVHASDYFGIGQATGAKVDVTEFQYAAVGTAFLGQAPIATLSALAQTGAGLMPSSNAVAFTTDHDTERASAIYYLDEPYYDLAMVFMLAIPYGYPSIMSSFAFDRSTQGGIDSGPPSDAQGNTIPVYDPTTGAANCATSPAAAMPGTWVCQHRQRSITNMLQFRKVSASQPITSWWDDGTNRIAFGRGSKGFVVINREGTAFDSTLQTGLPQGTYCDVVGGGLNGGTCSGATVTVDASGTAEVTLAAYTAAAFHVGAKL
jgi:alpha-amylase